MKQITKIILLAIVGVLATTVTSAEEVERTVDASSDGNVSISNIAGTIEVIAWSRAEVKVLADLGRDVEELIVERHGDEVVVKVKVPKRNSRNITSDLTIHVPEDSSIEVSAVSADVEVTGVRGELQLQSVSGEMTSDIFGSDVQIETVSGDIELAGNNLEMLTETSSVSGDIEASGLKGQVEAESVSGDVTLTDGSFDRLQAETINGDIDVEAELIDGGRLEVGTINGDVDIYFRGSVSARFDIETFNGEIDNCFGPDPERTSRYTPGRELVFTQGGGRGRVAIETLNGGITICQD
jgi:DUF4097 and DUF4098 domain-containing protein YvlB